MRACLREEIAHELASPGLEEASAVAGRIRATHGSSVVAILLYGSALRTGDRDTLLDLYVLTDSLLTFHGGRRIPALLNTVLPPTVSYWEADHDGNRIKAKVAVMELRDFARRARGATWDTTIWARFCQPARLVHARDAEAREAVTDALTDAVATAMWWASRLAPPGAGPEASWTGLFQRTYGAELRVEGTARAAAIYGWAAPRYDRFLALAPPRPGAAGFGRLSWALRRPHGKLLNTARLVKAAFTFRNGAEYLAWKIERHSGQPVALRPWQRRHPVLAAPAMLWRLWRQSLIR